MKIDANSIELRSPDGRYALRLAVADYGAWVTLSGPDGRRVNLTLNSVDAGLETYGQGGRQLVALGSVGDGEPKLGLLRGDTIEAIEAIDPMIGIVLAAGILSGGKARPDAAVAAVTMTPSQA